MSSRPCSAERGPLLQPSSNGQQDRDPTPSAHSSGNAEPAVRCALPIGVSTRASGIGATLGRRHALAIRPGNRRRRARQLPLAKALAGFEISKAPMVRGAARRCQRSPFAVDRLPCSPGDRPGRLGRERGPRRDSCARPRHGALRWIQRRVRRIPRAACSLQYWSIE